jgi:predicted AlkP superfamily pyrophosphatase or phosphodiesterase
MMRFLAAFLFVLCAACATPPASRAAAGDLTILVSIDGFRADYLDRGATPTLARLAATGARASMRPSFPSITFPNHYALVTGLTPDHSGLVGNTMEDAARPGVVFTMSAPTASDPIWWDGAEPIWVTAEKQGAPTATMFWPGSDYAIRGVQPGKWRAFDQTLTGFARVDQLLDWLDAPRRPRLAPLYFDLVDTAGHRYGPDAPETMSAAAEVDAAMARLVEGLRARGLAARANLIIVADHGMADVSEDRLIDLDALAGPDLVRVVVEGPYAALEPRAGRAADAERALVGRKAHGECWRKAEMPARLGYGAHPRVPAIVCLADIGWRFDSAQTPPYAGPPARGAHGFDPDAPEMAAVFIANGPAFRAGARLAPFRNVSVYPLLAKLAGVTPQPNDGSLADTAAALR